MEVQDNLPIPWRSICLCRQRHCCDFMQALSSASQFGTSWGGWGGEQGCGSCALEGMVTLGSVLCRLCGTVMGSLGWLLPVLHPLSRDAAEWSPRVMFTHPALKSLLTSLTTWKQHTGGFYLVRVWALLSWSERREPMTPQVSQPLLFSGWCWSSSCSPRQLLECK